ncbi:sulfatase-like hydrolase/transferase [Puniceicoccaceae bacterium]|nr:sulfatase-like hydrolase/transferase [Puniceicoccaceae bacterium]
MKPLLKSLLTLCCLAVVASQAVAETITASTADAQILSAAAGDQGGTFTLQSGATEMRAGRATNGAGRNVTTVIPFLLPDLGAVADPFVTSALTFNLNSNSGSYSADLYGLGARVDATVLGDDFYMGTAVDGSSDATKLIDSVLTTTTAAGTVTSADLSAWLNTQYADGANIGKYVFLRISAAVSSAIFDTDNGFVIASANAESDQPYLSYNTTVTIGSTGNGSVSPTGVVSVNLGDTLEITLTPDTDHHTEQVLIDGNPVSFTSTVTTPTVTQDMTVDVTFAPDVFYTVTISSGANGSISPTGSVQVLSGETLELTLDAVDYYHTEQVLVDGSPVSFASTVTTPVVTDNMTVVASFAPNRNFWGVPDWWMAEHNSEWMDNLLKETAADQDADGMATWEEYHAGMDATDPGSHFDVEITSTDGSIEASLDTVAVEDERETGYYRSYTLQETDDLTTAWVDVPGKTDITGAGQQVAHDLGSATASFVRAKVEVAETTPTNRPPNIILFLTDDLGWGDLAFKDHPYLITPNLDRMAEQGTVFDQFYASSPVCSPTRAGFMTGRYPAEVDIHTALSVDPDYNTTNKQVNYLPLSFTTITEVLQANGYATAHYGKWHLGAVPGSPAPEEYGIDHSMTAPSTGTTLRTSDYFDQFDPTYASQHYVNLSTHAMAHEAARFMEQHRDEPFYINIWTHLPHTTLNPTEDQLAVYAHLLEDGAVKASDFNNSPGLYAYMNSKGANLAAEMQKYCASVTPIDEALGVLLDSLEELGLAGNTIILFTSDNGPEDYLLPITGNPGMGSPGPHRARKRSLFEGGVRVPCIVRWPGQIPMGKVDTESVWSAADWFPTVVSLAGLEMPTIPQSGENVSEILLGNTTERTKPIMWEYINGVGKHATNGSPVGWAPPRLAIRDGDYKLFTGITGGGTMLFNIVDDPTESTDLVGDSAYADIITDLKAQVLAWEATLTDHR